MGWLSDNTKTAWGRRRPFMFFGCFFYAALFTLLLSPPRARGHEDGSECATFRKPVKVEELVIMRRLLKAPESSPSGSNN